MATHHNQVFASCNTKAPYLLSTLELALALCCCILGQLRICLQRQVLLPQLAGVLHQPLNLLCLFIVALLQPLHSSCQLLVVLCKCAGPAGCILQAAAVLVQLCLQAAAVLVL